MSQVLNSLSQAYADPGPLGICVRILTVVVVAWLASYLVGRLLPRLIFVLGPRKWRETFSPKRLVTLRTWSPVLCARLSCLVALIVICGCLSTRQ
jgi:hypothetical protein